VRLGRRPVVQDVSASVAAGRWLSVVGANGAGKSTLLRAVVGLVRHEGSIRLGGCDSAVMTNRQRARLVTMVAQNPVLPPAMSVNAYALLGRTAHLGPFGRESAEDLDRVAHALHRLDASDLATRPLGSLSGGEAQRVTIARALVQATPLLLLDEPTSSLDVGHQLAMLDLVDELRRERGLAVLSTMHDLTLAAQYADELLLLHQGTVVAAGPPASVLCEDNLTRYYGARVRVVRDGEALVVVPLRGAPAASVLDPPQP
jgi:iron complex transport system ATP-binding protein